MANEFIIKNGLIVAEGSTTIKSLQGTGTRYVVADAAGKLLTQEGSASVSQEDVQDIVGAMLTSSASIQFAYDDAANTASASVIDSYINNLADIRINLKRGAVNGIASLDANGRVPYSQLPTSLMSYLGTWNAATNSPVLANGTGDTGDTYRVSVAGSRDLGSGVIEFNVGDYIIYNGTLWEKSDTTDAVVSVNGMTGVVVLNPGNGLSYSSNSFHLGGPLTSNVKLDMGGTSNLSFDIINSTTNEQGFGLRFNHDNPYIDAYIDNMNSNYFGRMFIAPYLTVGKAGILIENASRASGLDIQINHSNSFEQQLNYSSVYHDIGTHRSQVRVDTTGIHMGISTTPSIWNSFKGISVLSGGEVRIDSYQSSRNDGNTTKALYVDASGNLRFGMVDLSSIQYTFTNGLNKVGTNVKLGGDVTAATSLNVTGGLFDIKYAGQTARYIGFLPEDAIPNVVIRINNGEFKVESGKILSTVSNASSSGIIKSHLTIHDTIADSNSYLASAQFTGTGMSRILLKPGNASLQASASADGTNAKGIKVIANGDIQLEAYPNTRNNGSTNKVLYVDASGNINYGSIDFTNGGQIQTNYSFVNGLVNTTGTVKLGGSLVEATTINMTTFPLALTNGNLLIGHSTNGSYRLDVVGTIAGTRLRLRTYGSEFVEEATRTYISANGDQFDILNLAGNKYISRTGNGSYSLMDASGAVAVKLGVTDYGDAPIVLGKHSTALNPLLGMTFATGGADSKHWSQVVDATKMYFRTVDDLKTTSTNWLIVTRSGNSISSMSFPNGNVLIGTTTETTRKLTVNGSSVFYNSVSLGTITTNENYNLHVETTLTNNTYINLYNNQNNTFNSEIRMTKNRVGSWNLTNGSRIGAIDFQNNTAEFGAVANGTRTAGGITYSVVDFIWKSMPTGADVVSAERMRLTSGGNLLINTTTNNTAYKLQVAGEILSALGTYTSVNTETKGIKLTGGLGTGFGNLGISFDLSGNLGASNGFIRSARTNSSAFVGLEIGNTSGSGIRLMTGFDEASERMRVTSNGNILVGLSTEDLNYRMNIFGNLNVTGDSVAHSRLVSETWESIQAGNALGIYMDPSFHTLTFKTNSAERMFISGTGNLVIGSSVDDLITKMQVYGDVILNNGEQTMLTVHSMTTSLIEFRISDWSKMMIGHGNSPADALQSGFILVEEKLHLGNINGINFFTGYCPLGENTPTATIHGNINFSAYTGPGERMVVADADGNIITKALTGNGIYYAEDYDVAPGSDVTTALQSLINYVFDNGGGTIVLPKGEYILPGSAIENSADPLIGNPASQLYVKRKGSSTGSSIVIRIKGEVGPNHTASVTQAYSPLKSSTVILSTSTGGGSQICSIFGTDGAGLFNDLNYGVEIELEDLCFQVVANSFVPGPNLNGLDLSGFGNATLKNVSVEVNTSMYAAPAPSVQVFGVRMPKAGNGSMVKLDNVLIGGFYFGLIVSEHTHGDNVHIMSCMYGVMFENSNHSVHFDRLGIHNCKFGLTSQQGPVSGPTSYAYLTIDHLDIEWDQAGRWFDSEHIVSDPLNELVGNIRYHVVQNGVGVNNLLFTKDGGLNIIANAIGTGGTGSIADIGTNQQVIYNQGGNLTGNDNFKFDFNTNSLNITGNLEGTGMFAKQIDETSGATFGLYNNIDSKGTIRMNGDAFGIEHFANTFTVGSDTGMSFVTNQNFATGGSDYISFYIGGYFIDQERIRLTVDGQHVFGKFGVNVPDLASFFYESAIVSSDTETKLGVYSNGSATADMGPGIMIGFSSYQSLNGLSPIMEIQTIGAATATDSRIRFNYVGKDSQGIVQMNTDDLLAIYADGRIKMPYIASTSTKMMTIDANGFISTLPLPDSTITWQLAFGGDIFYNTGDVMVGDSFTNGYTFQVYGSMYNGIQNPSLFEDQLEYHGLLSATDTYNLFNRLSINSIKSGALEFQRGTLVNANMKWAGDIGTTWLGSRIVEPQRVSVNATNYMNFDGANTYTLQHSATSISASVYGSIGVGSSNNVNGLTINAGTSMTTGLNSIVSNVNLRPETDLGTATKTLNGWYNGFMSMANIKGGAGSTIERINLFGAAAVIAPDSNTTIATVVGYYAEAIKQSYITNAWAFYQVGTNDKNYFAGTTLIGSSSDTGEKLQVTGTAKVTGEFKTGAATRIKRTQLAANTTLNDTHHYVAGNAVTAAITFTLPAASTCAERVYIIKKIDATTNKITIDANGSETIDGALNVSVDVQWDSITLISNGTNWEVL